MCNMHVNMPLCGMKEGLMDKKKHEHPPMISRSLSYCAHLYFGWMVMKNGYSIV